MMATLIPLGNFFFRYRNYLFPLLLLVALLFARPEFFRDRWTADLGLTLLGILTALAGQALRALTIGYRYIKRGGLAKKVYAETLVTQGVFAHCRNPLYVGNFLIFLGILLIVHAPLLYLIGLPFFILAYAAIVAAEENFLRTKFGAEFERYCGRVNRFWPRWQGFRASVADMRFDWRRVLNKEHTTTLVWIVAAVVLRGWKLYAIQGWAALGEIMTWAIGLLPFLAAYGVIRTLKKTGRLDS